MDIKTTLRRLLQLALAIVIAYFAYLQFFNKPNTSESDFTAELIDGSTFSLKDLRGNYVLLDFWGSWCPPCRRDNPNLVKLYKEFNNQTFKNAEGFEIVTIALEKNDKYWQKAATKDGFNWKYQIVEISKIVMLSSLAQKYGVKDIPTKFLIGPEGNIIGANQSYDELRSFLTKNK